MMHISSIESSPVHRRGGQSSYLLLQQGQFDARNLAITWVECPPGSEQFQHQHESQEQVYVIIRGEGVMRAGGEEQAVRAGEMIYIPPKTPHSIRNDSAAPMTYVSATSPPFDLNMPGIDYVEQR